MKPKPLLRREMPSRMTMASVTCRVVAVAGCSSTTAPHCECVNFTPQRAAEQYSAHSLFSKLSPPMKILLQNKARGNDSARTHSTIVSILHMYASCCRIC
eukprot:10173-Heterococcus_DN1.PRE.2